MKDKFSGKILDGGLCICDVYGQKSKLGGFINPMSPDPQVVCYDCMTKASAEENGISFIAGKFYLLSGGHISYPPAYLNEKLNEILKAYRKSGRTDGVNNFLRHNGYIFGQLL